LAEVLQRNGFPHPLLCTDRRSLRQPELEPIKRRAKNPLTIRRRKANAEAYLIEEEPIDLDSIQRKTLDYLSHHDYKGLALYAGSILFVILKSDDDREGLVCILPRELAIKRGIRGLTKLTLSLLLLLASGIISFAFSWLFDLLVPLFFESWFHHARILLIDGVVHFLSFSALLDFLMAGFGWAMVRDMESGDAAASAGGPTVYYNIAEAFYDPYWATSLSDFWGRRFHAGLRQSLSKLTHALLLLSPFYQQEATPTYRAMTGLPLYLVTLGLLHLVISLLVERRLVFSVLLFYLLHAFFNLMEALVAEADKSTSASSQPSSPSSSPSSPSLWMYVGQQIKQARDVALPSPSARKYVGMALFWLVLYITLPLYFAPDHFNASSPEVDASTSGPAYLFNVWILPTPTTA